MNILMFNYEYPPVGGGGGVIHRYTAEVLARRHQVTVVTSGFGRLPAYEEVNGVQVHRVKTWGRRSSSTAGLLSMLSYFPASLALGEQLIRQQRPDVINTHFAVPTGPSATRLALRHDIRHLLCIHGGDIYDPTKRLSPHRWPLLRYAVRRVLRSADRIVAPSRNTADNTRRYYRHVGPIEIIPHGIPRPPSFSASRRALNLPDDRPVLISVGRLIRRKANDRLLHIFAGLRNQHARLVILGDGPQRENLEALAGSLGIREQVHFTGFVSERKKLQYLQASDAFVSTTVHEGFGLMYLEAMFCGLPIVTYNHGGQSDFLADGRTGFQVPLLDEETFAERLGTLLRDPELRQRLGQQNRVAAEAFTVEACAGRYERILEAMTFVPAARPAPAAVRRRLAPS